MSGDLLNAAGYGQHKILWTSFEFEPYQTKNVDNMGKLSFTPLSKHALLCPFMELELGCQLFVNNSCTEFLRNLTGGVVAARSLAEGWICCQYKALFFIHKDCLRSDLYTLLKERFVWCFFVSWNGKKKQF